MQPVKQIPIDVKHFEMVRDRRSEVPMWPVESREMYRKGTAMHPPTTMHPPCFPPPLAPPPRYQFTTRDLDRCLYDDVVLLMEYL